MAAIPAAVWLGFVVCKSVGLAAVFALFAALIAAVFVTDMRARRTFAGVFALVLLAIVAEFALWLTGWGEGRPDAWARGRELRYASRIIQPDWDLGYTALANTVTQVTARRYGKQVYDVVYSFDARGARANGTISAGAAAIVVAGDSFNFGEGLNDTQTLSAALQQKLPRRPDVPNFAMPNYGVHQVLRQIELDVFRRAAPASFDWLVLSVGDDAIARANGRDSRAKGEPKYMVAEDGRLRLVGKFGEGEETVWQQRLSEGSRLYGLAGAATRPASDEQNFVAILRTVRESVERKYRARVLVLYHPGHAYFDDFTGDRLAMRGLLRDAGVTFIDIAEAIPGLDQRYFIAGDGHPNATLNDVLADLILQVAAKRTP